MRQIFEGTKKKIVKNQGKVLDGKLMVIMEGLERSGANGFFLIE